MSELDDPDSDASESLNIFDEPSDYYVKEKPASFQSHRFLDGREIQLRLVGQSPLWGHYLWNAGKIISAHLERHADQLVRGKTVLELGAGAGLPSLTAALNGAAAVVVTDYPDADLIENLAINVRACQSLDSSASIHACGLLWGASTEEVISRLPQRELPGFDVLILADLLFNHSEHAKLLSTLSQTLRRNPGSKALVFFTPYRPWLLQKDLAFFDLAREQGFHVSKILETVMDTVMFENDPGDELLRRTVFGYEVTWGSLG